MNRIGSLNYTGAVKWEVEKAIWAFIIPFISSIEIKLATTDESSFWTPNNFVKRKPLVFQKSRTILAHPYSIPEISVLCFRP